MEDKWIKVRELYPALNKGVFLSSAAVAPLSTPVYQANKAHLEMMYQTGDVQWEKSVELMNVLRKKVSDYINVNPNEVSFGHNTSLNMNWISMLIKSQNPKGKVLTLEQEFPSTVIPWMHHGFEVEKLNIKSYENPEDEIIQRAKDSGCNILVVSHQQYSNGLRLNLKVLGDFCKKQNITFIVNATQSLGIFPIDCEENNISALTASCHKWMTNGYGMSLLYVKKDLWQNATWPVAGWLSQDEEHFMQHGELSFKEELSVLEVGVPAFQLIHSLNAQMDFLSQFKSGEIADRVLELQDYLTHQLRTKCSGLRFDHDSEQGINSHNSGTVFIHHSDPELLVEKLMAESIYVSARAGGLRVSVSYYNNRHDIDTFVEAMVQYTE